MAPTLGADPPLPDRPAGGVAGHGPGTLPRVGTGPARVLVSCLWITFHGQLTITKIRPRKRRSDPP
jgi:hypothetical protein